jgi:hypothetical protein
MDEFKVGDKVLVTDEYVEVYGQIDEIDADGGFAYVAFRTPHGGGTLPFDLSNLKHVTEDLKENKNDQT